MEFVKFQPLPVLNITVNVSMNAFCRSLVCDRFGEIQINPGMFFFLSGWLTFFRCDFILKVWTEREPPSGISP